MGEVLAIMFHPINIVFTALLGLVVIYWITVIIGAVDMDSLDMDLSPDVDADVDLDLEVDPSIDMDADADIEVDADADADIGAGGGGGSVGVLGSTLIFVNAHYVPLSIVLSIFILCLWSLTMMTTLHLNPEFSGLRAIILFVINWIISILVTKVVTTPLAKLLAKTRKEEREQMRVIGKSCTLLTPATWSRHGQAEIITNGAPLLLTVRTREGVEIPKGSEAAIIRYDEDKGFYLVEPIS